jgi:hypothetical protein
MADPASADPSNSMCTLWALFMNTAHSIRRLDTLGSFLTSLALNGGLLVLQVAIFVLLKNRLSRIYQPRTYLPPPDVRSKPVRGIWSWFPQILSTPAKTILHVNGLDAYMSVSTFS